jgi:N-carbamoylputrescine amidase
LIQAANVAPTDAPIAEIKQANLDHQMKMVEEAAKQNVQMLCFQEIFTTPYFCAEQQTRWYEAVEKIPDGKTIRFMQDVAKQFGMVLIVPIYEEEIAGVYYNSAAVIDADGTYLGKYRKNAYPARQSGFLGEILFSSRQSWLSVFRYGVCAHRRLHLLRPSFSRRREMFGFERRGDYL